MPNWSKQEIGFLKDNYTKYSYKNLAEKIGRTENSVKHRISRLGEKKFIYNFKITGELSYILGVMFGDGYISNRYVLLKVKDFDFAEIFNKNMSVILNRKPTKIFTNISNGRKYFMVSFGSASFIKWFKSKKFEDIKKIVDNHPKEFIRGFSDSEGSCGIYTSKNKKYYSIRIANKNLEILRYIQNKLLEFGIKSHLNKQTRANFSWYILGMSGKKQTNKFMTDIGFSIKRKQDRWLDERKKC
jgi:intein-encoded DNA endonuclease-like protein